MLLIFLILFLIFVPFVALREEKFLDPVWSFPASLWNCHGVYRQHRWDWWLAQHRLEVQHKGTGAIRKGSWTDIIPKFIWNIQIIAEKYNFLKKTLKYLDNHSCSSLLHFTCVGTNRRFCNGFHSAEGAWLCVLLTSHSLGALFVCLFVIISSSLMLLSHNSPSSSLSCLNVTAGVISTFCHTEGRLSRKILISYCGDS